jgi:hypothetical protein
MSDIAQGDIYKALIKKAAEQLWLVGDVYGSAAVQEAMRQAGLGFVADHNLTPEQFHELRIAGLIQLMHRHDATNSLIRVTTS